MKIRIFNEVRDPEGERIAYEEQLLTEAVENIIPPSMTVLISAIKDKVFPNKAHEDILAKYVAAYFPVNDGSGKHFNVQLMNNIFNNAVGGIMLFQPFEIVWVQLSKDPAENATSRLRCKTVALDRPMLFNVPFHPHHIKHESITQY